MFKRLHKDLRDAITAGHKIYWHKTEHEKYYNYHILWVLKEKNVPDEITREYILPGLEKKAIAHGDIHNSANVQHNFIIKKIINNRKWNIKFHIPLDFPFKPPTFTLNNVSGSQLKNIGNKNYNKDSKVLKLLVDIDSKFKDQWTPTFRLKHCIDFIRMALDIHHHLPYKSNFLSIVDKCI